MFDLMKKKEVPFLFHCTAGKDRTGVAAYLILKTLGVSDEIIMKDYLLSNSYLKEINEKIVALSPQLSNIDDLLYVKEEYLLDTINAIHDKYKDFTTFLNEEYQLNEEDIKKLQEMYLV